jgi:hypothetical protein
VNVSWAIDRKKKALAGFKRKHTEDPCLDVSSSITASDWNAFLYRIEKEFPDELEENRLLASGY